MLVQASGWINGLIMKYWKCDYCKEKFFYFSGSKLLRIMYDTEIFDADFQLHEKTCKLDHVNKKTVELFGGIYPS